MVILTQTAEQVFAGYTIDGTARQISPAEAAAWGTEMERTVDALSDTGTLRGGWDASTGTFPGSGTAALGDAWLVTTAGTTGGVTFGQGDRLVATKANPSTSIYAGNWQAIRARARAYIPGTDAGAGTANAIQITTPEPVLDGSVVMFQLFRATTGSPVTISVNGGVPLTAMTPMDALASALGAGQEIWFRVRSSDSTARMINDQDVAALVAQAEAARDAAVAAAIDAENYAALARNDVVVDTFIGNGSQRDFPLTADPGSKNNIWVNLNGVPQLRASYSLVYIADVPVLRFFEAPPNLLVMDVVYGSHIVVGAPGAKTVTYDKIQDVSAALRLLGRKAGSPGVVQEITPDELRDLFLPAGAVIQTVEATPYVANANLSTVVPLDDTVPQSTEGTQILTATITPRSSTSKIRARWRGYGTIQTAPGTWIWAIFNGGASAIQAGYQTVSTADYSFPAIGEATYSPGSVSPQTISVRVGPITGAGNLRMNGNTAGRLLGGAAQCTLILEEIKA